MLAVLLLLPALGCAEGLTVKGMTLGTRWDALDKSDARTARCEQVEDNLTRCDFLDTYWGHETTFYVFHDPKGIITLITIDVPEGIGPQAEFDHVVNQYGQPSKRLPGVFFWDAKETTVLLVMKTGHNRDNLIFRWNAPKDNAQVTNHKDT
ncbi:MAG: hypothetical protein ACRDHZ_07340 [Ktedonobacteraceae bacterium]